MPTCAQWSLRPTSRILWGSPAGTGGAHSRSCMRGRRVTGPVQRGAEPVRPPRRELPLAPQVARKGRRRRGHPSAGGPSRARLATAASRPPPPALRPHPGTWRFRPHRPQPPRRQRPISGARRLPHRPSPPRDSRLPAARGDVGRAIARSDGSLWGTRPLMCGSARVPGVSL